MNPGADSSETRSNNNRLLVFGHGGQYIPECTIRDRAWSRRTDVTADRCRLQADSLAYRLESRLIAQFVKLGVQHVDR